MAFKSDQLPVVSIIIPLHNHENVIGAAIESCLGQAYPNVEVVVVDDCSSDSSVEVARSYEPCVRIIRAPQPLGACKARNVGLSHATGDFVLFHESDDLLFPDRLWHDLDVISRQPCADVVISINRRFIDGEPLLYDPEPICRRERRLLRHATSVAGATERSIISMLRYGGPQHSCALYKTSVARTLGGYIDEVEPYADRDLLFRALCRGATVVVNPRVSAAWRLHDCAHRVIPPHRKDDHIHRLVLAKRYAAALEQAGLLYHKPVLSALITHVIGRVYDYAEQRQHHEIAGAALNLVALLRAWDKSRPFENHSDVSQEMVGLMS